jgi:hypothetical protein
MIARAYLFAIATGLTWIGLAFVSFAIFSYLARTLSPDAAAGLTAVIVFACVGAGAAILTAATQTPAPQPVSLLNSGLAARLQQMAPELAPEIAGFASRHPLFAVGIAAAMGLAATSSPNGSAQSQSPNLHH